MSDKTAIAWTDATCTPIRARNLETGKVGWHCEHASEGCRNCYSETQNVIARGPGTGLPFAPHFRKGVELFLDHDHLTRPLRWRKPRRIFWCSMTDLFADFVPDEWIDQCFAVFALAPQHTFQVLTKRPERMAAYLADLSTRARAWSEAGLWLEVPRRVIDRIEVHGPGDDNRVWNEIDSETDSGTRPLRNVWLGVSVEDQATADERIPLLLQTPAAVRWVSYEPALAGVDFRRWVPVREAEPFEGAGDRCSRCGELWEEGMSRQECPEGYGPGLDWIVVGGESGPGARPFDLAWARNTVAQCKAAGVPVFVKQLGARPYRSRQRDDGKVVHAWDEPLKLDSSKGGDPSEWPQDLRVREFPA